MERPVGQLFVPSLIGIWLGPRLMTLHSFPARLMAYASSIMTSGTQVLTPVATTMHAKNRHTEQQELVLEGSKYCCALGLYFLCLFLWLGQPLFQLWVPSLDDSAQQLLVILALGELLPMSQWINYGVILGKGRHKVMAWISIFELIATISLAWVLSGPYGLVGICAAVAGTGALCRGICQAVYCCWLVGVSLTEYLTRAFVLPMVSAAAPGVGLFLLTTWNKPNTWLELGLYGVIFTVVYLICGAFVLLGSDRLRLWAQMLRDRWTDSGIPLAASPSVTPVEAAPTPGVERNGQGNQTHEYPVHVARTDA
jgi:O-antigen/teichoic acid export membrane protein